MANTPPCRGYVSRMRPPPPPTTTHPSLVYVMLGASQYGRQLIQPSPLFLPWPPFPPSLPSLSLSLFFRPYPPPLFPAMLLPSRFFSSSSSSLFSSFHRSPPWPPCLFTPFFLLHPASPFSTLPSRSAVLSLPFRLAHIRASLTCMPVSYMSSASFHPPPRTTTTTITTTYLFHALPSSFLRPSCISLLSFSLHPLDLYSSSLASPLTSPLRLRPSSGFHQHPGERVTLTTTIRKGTYIQREATHSPVRVQGKLRRSRICTGTVHQRRPPSRTRPATETENMGAIVLRPLPIFFFRFFLLFFFLAFLSFLSVSCFFPGTENVASRLPPWSLPDPSPPALSFRNAAFESSSQFYLFAATFCHCDFTRSFFLFSFFDSFYLIYKRFPINDEIIRMKISKRLERILIWILRLFLQSTFLNLKINQLITFFLYFFIDTWFENKEKKMQIVRLPEEYGYPDVHRNGP